MDQNIFREYDIRGIVGDQLTDETVDMLGPVPSARFFSKTVRSVSPLGYDARESSPRFCEMMAAGLQRDGLRCRPDRHGADAGALSHGLHKARSTAA